MTVRSRALPSGLGNMEEPGEQITVIFALVATSECVREGVVP